MSILDAVPTKFRAGDTWRLLLELADYPAPTWTATIYFENGGKSVSQVASASSTSHSITLSAATTGAIPPGRYRWFLRVTDGSVVETALEGWLDVEPDPAAAGTYDHRGNARRLLEAVEAALLGTATSNQMAMAINGRSISRIPLIELRQFRNELRQEVKTQEQGDRAGLGRNIKARYGTR